MEGLKASFETLQKERLKEPGRVGQVPWGHAGIGHGRHLPAGLVQGAASASVWARIASK